MTPEVQPEVHPEDCVATVGKVADSDRGGSLLSCIISQANVGVFVAYSWEITTFTFLCNYAT